MDFEKKSNMTSFLFSHISNIEYTHYWRYQMEAHLKDGDDNDDDVRIVSLVSVVSKRNLRQIVAIFTEHNSLKYLQHVMGSDSSTCRGCGAHLRPRNISCVTVVL